MKSIRHSWTYSQKDLAQTAQRLWALVQSSGAPLITFEGPFGAGKTTLITTLLKQVGVEDDITSPTYSYVNCYSSSLYPQIFHFDLYRLNTAQDFLNAGFEEYLTEAGSLILIEWPAIIMNSLPRPVCHVVLSYHHELEERQITIECR